MNELQLIQSKIYEIRGQKVMLDFDLAEMYGLETKRLKEAVRRNIDRFEGDDFMFQLTKEEVTELSRSQIATLNKGRGYNIKYAPFAFGELGIAMLSSVLNSKTAIEINRGIMRAFVVVRQLLTYPSIDRISGLQCEIQELKEYIEDVFMKNPFLSSISQTPPRNLLFFQFPAPKNQCRDDKLPQLPMSCNYNNCNTPNVFYLPCSSYFPPLLPKCDA